ncbi:inositol monophosphatase family protein [Natronorubrum sp. FCH18a]|uniref:inositol monophosphatase family protein n=1 Tax=Natronorubrum sp. FCH18a TaxID=3447018 RepID=UPI003F51710D
MTSVHELERTAIEACTVGGAYLREAYRAEDTDVDAGVHDVKSSADTEAERRILEVIRAAFPDHPIVAEESGRHEGAGEYTWLVDPLDGTNNFESGLPSFATAVTVLEGDGSRTGLEGGDSGSGLEDARPVLGVVYVPLLDDLYVAARGGGVRHNGQPISAASDASPETATAVSVIGHDVKRRPEQAAVSESINRALEDRCKRRLESWSPTVHWGLLARGRLDGIVCYRPDAEEQLLGELFAAESGLRTAASGCQTGADGEHDSDLAGDGAEWFVGAANEALFDALLEIAETNV